MTYDRDEGKYPAVVLNPSGTLESFEELFKTSEDLAPPSQVWTSWCGCSVNTGTLSQGGLRTPGPSLALEDDGSDVERIRRGKYLL